MKKIIVFFILMLPTLIGFSQSEIAKKDTVQSKMLVLVMPEKQWIALIDLLKTADEKPSILNADIKFITDNLKEINEKAKAK